MEHPQTHTQQRVKTSTKKKLPMDYNNVNRWYNIGIKPIQDYIDSSMYPTITTNETII